MVVNLFYHLPSPTIFLEVVEVEEEMQLHHILELEVVLVMVVVVLKVFLDLLILYL